MDEYSYSFFKCPTQTFEESDQNVLCASLPTVYNIPSQVIHVTIPEENPLDENHSLVIIYKPRPLSKMSAALKSHPPRSYIGLPSTDHGLLITLAGFLIVFFLSNLLSKELQFVSANWRLVINAMGTFFLIISPAIYIRTNSLNFKACFRLQKGTTTRGLCLDSVYGALTIILAIFSLSIWMLSSHRAIFVPVESMRITNKITSFLVVISVVILPSICEGIYTWFLFFIIVFFSYFVLKFCVINKRC
ncbi:hypothetical protein M0813_24131 [Anaeramoeba flamelloides]|uniref:Uncharacterized protein n=1 Tax=Anaeramoeba flamelloides TaxID=1746091 RepID=A0ABQ8Y6G7_9EUKA|nr:hypothetical protein M0813_24131 [Anaeramoeba flamelloides]